MGKKLRGTAQQLKVGGTAGVARCVCTIRPPYWNSGCAAEFANERGVPELSSPSLDWILAPAAGPAVRAKGEVVFVHRTGGGVAPFWGWYGCHHGSPNTQQKGRVLLVLTSLRGVPGTANLRFWKARCWFQE